ncbi:MAG TPA: zinc-ribbon domain-containing protein [Nitriliruptorales bacterium]|nr:zinc-ribbon domain-containing protein [Nitriliruptorales bacterium]
MAICVNCGFDNADDARYCEECGVELGRSTTPDAHPDAVIDDPTVAGSSSWTAREQRSDRDTPDRR